MILGIDHGCSGIRTARRCFPAGVTEYDQEFYSSRYASEYDGRFPACGTGRRLLGRDKTTGDSR